VTAAIRSALSEDADFIAHTILSAQRGPMPRGWFDIALDLPEPQCLAFVTRIATAQSNRGWPKPLASRALAVAPALRPRLVPKSASTHNQSL
jgi:hypothetical protein